MRCVPVAAAAAAFGAEARILCADHLVRLGRRVEVDVDSMRAAGAHDAADTLWTYWQRSHIVDGGDLTVVTLLHDHEQNSGARKADLREVYTDLRAHPVTGPVLEHACGATPDPETLRDLLDVAGSALHLESGQCSFTVELSPTYLPATLGGPRLWRETTRRITVVVRHAPWRDRRIRRLSRVLVESIQRWPEPDPRT